LITTSSSFGLFSNYYEIIGRKGRDKKKRLNESERKTERHRQTNRKKKGELQKK